MQFEYLKETRLLVSGCSFTDYCWSTWADYLSPYFAQFDNVGVAASDNATIARNVIDSVRPHDNVIIMWTGFDRWSGYSESPPTKPKNNISVPPKNNHHWCHIGSIRANKLFLVNHYHKVERFQTTMDYINLLDSHSYKNNYTVHHFSAFPILLGEIEKDLDPRITAIYNKYSIANNHLEEPSLQEYQIQNDQYIKTKHEYHPTDYSDNHPTPLTHWEYCSKIIGPKIGIDLGSNVPEYVLEEQHDLIVNHHASKYDKKYENKSQ